MRCQVVRSLALQVSNCQRWYDPAHDPKGPSCRVGRHIFLSGFKPRTFYGTAQICRPKSAAHEFAHLEDQGRAIILEKAIFSSLWIFKKWTLAMCLTISVRPPKWMQLCVQAFEKEGLRPARGLRSTTLGMHSRAVHALTGCKENPNSAAVCSCLL